MFRHFTPYGRARFTLARGCGLKHVDPLDEAREFLFTLARGCGLKPWDAQGHGGRFGVHPRARVWIETVKHRREAVGTMVHPRARVWIETDVHDAVGAAAVGFTLARGCGLKLAEGTVARPGPAGHPRAGVWIVIYQPCASTL